MQSASTSTVPHAAGLWRGLRVGNLKHVSRAPSQSLHHHTISVLCSLYSADLGPGLLTASLWCHKKYFGSVSYLKCDDRILLQQTWNSPHLTYFTSTKLAIKVLSFSVLCWSLCQCFIFNVRRMILHQAKSTAMLPSPSRRRASAEDVPWCHRDSSAQHISSYLITATCCKHQ